jgi:hypothetical protein
MNSTIIIDDITVHNNPDDYINMYVDECPFIVENDYVSLWNGLGETYLLVRHTILSMNYNIKNNIREDRELFFIGRVCDHTFTPTEKREYVFFKKKYIYRHYLKNF